MTTTARTEAWYRRETAIHEAGHFVIAKHLGIRSRARIYRHETYGWTGEVVPETSTKRLSKHEKLMIAVAGFVATAMWVKDDPTAVLEKNSAVISKGDWKMCGGRPKNAELIHDAIRAVADILNRDIGERWGDLLSVSRTLIERKAAFTRRNYV